MMSTASIIFFWAIISFIVGVAADTRKRDFLGWFLLAAILSPVIAGLLLIALPKGELRPGETSPSIKFLNRWGPTVGWVYLGLLTCFAISLPLWKH